MKMLPFAVVALLWLSAPLAQTLPPHDPLRVLIVSDEVNPHGLPPESLTQPGEIGAALAATAALNIDAQPDAILEVPTNQIELATAALNVPFDDAQAYDVLIYFAHRAPNNGNNDQPRQEAFVNAVEQFLEAGGGVISFHHGIYLGAGKTSMLNLLGAQATGSVPWNTVDGQNVINVDTGAHFIVNHAINYDLAIAYSNPAHGVPAGTYPAFNNTPDERYPQMDFNGGNTGCEIQVLLQSNYDAAGDLLAYDKHCPDWRSRVFVYQPGEYQPHALEPGNNYQILLNAVVHLSHFNWDVIFRDDLD